MNRIVSHAVIGLAIAALAIPAASAQKAATATARKPVAAASGTYTLDPGHTMVLAQWSHLGFSHPSANFGISEGTLVFDARNPARSSVQVTLPLAGMTSFVAKLDEHLRGGDFFDAGKFPAATFRSTAVKALGGNRYRVDGLLTIKGVARPVTLDAVLNGAGTHPMTKKAALGFDATATLKRSDWGMTYGTPMVGDDVSLRITTEGEKRD